MSSPGSASSCSPGSSPRLPLLAAAILVLGSCGGDAAGPPSGGGGATSVAVTPATVSLTGLGDTLRLEARGLDASGGTVGGLSFAWTSSNPNIAAVDAAGLLTAVSNGSVTVSAVAGTLVGSATVTVESSTGGVRFITGTAGRNLDPDGFTAMLDGASVGAIGLDDTLTVLDVPPGTHPVTLSGLLPSCHADPAEPVMQTVVAGSVAEVVFGVECLGVPANISLAFTRAETEADPPRLNIVGLTDGGTVPVQLTFHRGLDRGPDWSADGSRLAFTRDGVICVVNSDGTDLRAFDQGEHPDWSPDGTRIVFDNGTWVFVFEPDGSGEGVLLARGAEPDWSPDGTKIAFIAPSGDEYDIFVMNADGTGVVNLTNSPTLLDREPTWSPDGARIAFRRLDRSESVGYDLWVMDADGSNQTRLLSQPGAQTQPTWLPDDRLLFDNPGGNIMSLALGTGEVSQVIGPEASGVFYWSATWRSVP